jgi:hypothetical protein
MDSRHPYLPDELHPGQAASALTYEAIRRPDDSILLDRSWEERNDGFAYRAFRPRLVSGLIKSVRRRTEAAHRRLEAWPKDSLELEFELPYIDGQSYSEEVVVDVATGSLTVVTDPAYGELGIQSFCPDVPHPSFDLDHVVLASVRNTNETRTESTGDSPA